MPDSQPDVSIADVAGRVLARWRTVVVTTVVVVLVALLAALRWPEQFTATAVVTVSPITATPFEPAQVNIETERAVVSSTEVARVAAETLETDRTPADLLTSVSVTAPDESQVLQIQFRAGDAETAARGANAFAEAYLRLRSRGADEIAQRIINNLETRINDLLADMPAPPSEGDESDAGDPALQQQIATMQQQISALREQQNALATVGLNPGRAIGPAEPPDSPSSPQPPIFLAAGLAFGLLAGVAMALLRERTDSRVRTAGRLSAALGEPVVGDSDGDPREPFRRALVALGADDHRDADTPMVVNVQSYPAPGRTRDVAAELADAAREAARKVTVIRVDDDFGNMIDRGWPKPSDRVAWIRVDLVVIDSSKLTSPVRREVLARRCDRTVLAAHARSKLSQVSAGVTNLRAADVPVDVVLALTHAPPRPSPGVENDPRPPKLRDLPRPTESAVKARPTGSPR